MLAIANTNTAQYTYDMIIEQRKEMSFHGVRYGEDTPSERRYSNQAS